MESLKKTFFSKQLSIEDLSYIAKLLNNNIPLHQALDLIKNKSNEKIFNAITSSLDQGKMIEEIIKDYLPKQIKSYMIPLLKNMSLVSALNLSLDFYNKHAEDENKITSSIAYPCILLFITVTVLYLFDLYGMDTIFGLISGFNANLEIYKSLRILFRIFINIFYYGLLLGILLVIIFIQPKRITLLYIFLSKHFPNSLVNTYYSQEFVSLRLICVQKGYKTKESLQILIKMKSKPIVSFLAFHMDESLLEGQTLKEAAKSNYYDLTLSRFIKIANYTNDFENMLKTYLSLCKEKINITMKKYTTTIQISTYLFIGAIVVFIYEVLFVPMQAISNF